MTTEHIELDALANAPEQSQEFDFTQGAHGWQSQAPPAAHQHDHAPDMYFTPSPRSDNLLERFRSFVGLGDALKTGTQVFKGADGLRYMFLISSNSYEDRESETMTTKALNSYEASCYPGDGMYYCDNPFLWFHDPDVPMGTIEAVTHIQPFLIEIAKELPNDPVAKVLWDYAEKQGDKAGASIRFGYREEDRSDEGDYDWIRKIETSYLPERALAANIRTYAGVINDMSSPESDKRLNAIFKEATGGSIENAAQMLHAKSSEFKKKLAALGIGHKAKKQKAEGDPPIPPDEEVVDGEEVVEDEAKVEGAAADLGQIIALVSQLYAIISEQVASQDYLMDEQLALGKAFKALSDKHEKEKALNTTLEQRVSIVEKRLNLQARTVTEQKGSNPESLAAVIQTAIQEKDAGQVQKIAGWGDYAPPIDYTSVTGK